MTIWRLTEHVAWGNSQALEEIPSWVKWIVAVGGNLEGRPLSQTPLGIPETIPYLRVAWPDSEEPPDDYWRNLELILIPITYRSPIGILVHCRAGQMRSPAVAAYFAHRIDGRTFAQELDRARDLRPDICYDCKDGERQGMKPYVRGMLKHFGVKWE